MCDEQSLSSVFQFLFETKFRSGTALQPSIGRWCRRCYGNSRCALNCRVARGRATVVDPVAESYPPHSESHQRAGRLRSETASTARHLPANRHENVHHVQRRQVQGVSARVTMQSTVHYRTVVHLSYTSSSIAGSKMIPPPSVSHFWAGGIFYRPHLLAFLDFYFFY